MSTHDVTVTDQYRRVQTWEARCSCGWTESSAFAVFADAAAARHVAAQQQRPADQEDGE